MATSLTKVNYQICYQLTKILLEDCEGEENTTWLTEYTRQAKFKKHCLYSDELKTFLEKISSILQQQNSNLALGFETVGMFKHIHENCPLEHSVQLSKIQRLLLKFGVRYEDFFASKLIKKSVSRSRVATEQYVVQDKNIFVNSILIAGYISFLANQIFDLEKKLALTTVESEKSELREQLESLNTAFGKELVHINRLSLKNLIIYLGSKYPTTFQNCHDLAIVFGKRLNTNLSRLTLHSAVYVSPFDEMCFAYSAIRSDSEMEKGNKKLFISFIYNFLVLRLEDIKLELKGVERALNSKSSKFRGKLKDKFKKIYDFFKYGAINENKECLSLDIITNIFLKPHLTSAQHEHITSLIATLKPQVDRIKAKAKQAKQARQEQLDKQKSSELAPLAQAVKRKFHTPKPIIHLVAYITPSQLKSKFKGARLRTLEAFAANHNGNLVIQNISFKRGGKISECLAFHHGRQHLYNVLPAKDNGSIICEATLNSSAKAIKHTFNFFSPPLQLRHVRVISDKVISTFLSTAIASGLEVIIDKKLGIYTLMHAIDFLQQHQSDFKSKNLAIKIAIPTIHEIETMAKNTEIEGKADLIGQVHTALLQLTTTKPDYRMQL